jgi:hypothetical protein
MTIRKHIKNNKIEEAISLYKRQVYLDSLANESGARAQTGW